MCLTQNQLSQIDKINSFMTQILLDPKDTATLSSLLFISIRLRNLGLIDIYDEIDILIETYTRAIERVRKDENYEIINLSAWFKQVANHIISDLCKARDKHKNVSRDIEVNYRLVDNIDIDPRVETITEAFSCLNAEDREILTLRIVKGLSWADIAAKFISEGRKNEEGGLLENDNTFRACLRKRFSRAKIRLREQYINFSKG